MPIVLFVCMANRSRSPIAAASFRKELAERGLLQTWRVLSAGTWTEAGLGPTADAVTSAARLGLDLSEHLSSPITSGSIEEADLIVVMEHGQKEALEHEFGGAHMKVHLLSEAATGSSYDIPDPVSSGSAAEIHAEIAGLVHEGFDRICALANTR